MPKLIKHISTTYSESIKDDVSLSDNITMEFGEGDYQKVGNLTGFFQDYTRIEETEEFNKSATFGLITNKNKTFTEIEISY